MEEREIRLRLIEAAARNPQPHDNGYAVSVREAAECWFRWVTNSTVSNKPLGLPKK